MTEQSIHSNVSTYYEVLLYQEQTTHVFSHPTSVFFVRRKSVISWEEFVKMFPTQ